MGIKKKKKKRAIFPQATLMSYNLEKKNLTPILKKGHLSLLRITDSMRATNYLFCGLVFTGGLKMNIHTHKKGSKERKKRRLRTQYMGEKWQPNSCSEAGSPYPKEHTVKSSSSDDTAVVLQLVYGGAGISAAEHFTGHLWFGPDSALQSPCKVRAWQH